MSPKLSRHLQKLDLGPVNAATAIEGISISASLATFSKVRSFPQFGDMNRLLFWQPSEDYELCRISLKLAGLMMRGDLRPIVFVSLQRVAP